MDPNTSYHPNQCDQAGLCCRRIFRIHCSKLLEAVSLVPLLISQIFSKVRHKPGYFTWHHIFHLFAASQLKWWLGWGEKQHSLLLGDSLTQLLWKLLILQSWVIPQAVKWTMNCSCEGTLTAGVKGNSKFFCSPCDRALPWHLWLVLPCVKKNGAISLAVQQISVVVSLVPLDQLFHWLMVFANTLLPTCLLIILPKAHPHTSHRFSLVQIKKKSDGNVCRWSH